MPEPREHYQQRGAIETLLRQIPGFRGYLEREYRRDSDQLQREWLAQRLERSKRGLDNLAAELASAGRIDLLPRCDRLRGRIDRLIFRMRGDVQGYSGFFDLVQVDVARLDKVYEHDVAIMTRVSDVADVVNRLEAGRPDLERVLDELLEQVQELDRAWDQRADILQGLE